jgi:hypothetical protein
MMLMLMMMMIVMVLVLLVAVVVVIPLYPGWLYRSQRYSLQQHQHQEDLRLWDGVLRYASDLQPGDVCWWGPSAARFVLGATWVHIAHLVFLGWCIYRHAYLLAWNICISTCASYIDR